MFQDLHELHVLHNVFQEPVMKEQFHVHLPTTPIVCTLYLCGNLPGITIHQTVHTAEWREVRAVILRTPNALDHKQWLMVAFGN
jgi:hypothetical protein